MQQHIQSLVQHLFQKDTLQDVTEQELRQFTTTYPYAAAGHLLFVKKLQETNAPDYREQAEKTAVYFNNAAWLYWLLQDHAQPAVQEVQEAVKATEPEHHPVAESNGLQAHEAIAVLPEAVTEEEEAGPVDIQEQETETVAPAEPVTEEPVAAVDNTPGNNLHTAAGDGNDTELVFEPYHTIDYFASQGIKLTPEDFTKDRLGQQLKSFTEWLRGMKRIAPATNNEELDENTRQSIQQFAEHSVEGNEIITETMAEVWAKQGNIEKAIALYDKLSLLNPAKSAYFAARIEQLKVS